MSVHPELIDLVVCPKCRGKLVLQSGASGEAFECHACRVAYPINADGIPQLLEGEAKPMGGTGPGAER